MRDCMEIIMRHSVWSSSKQFVVYLGISMIFRAGRGLTAEDDLHITATSRYPRGSVVCGASRGGSNEDDLNITSTGRCPRGSVVSGAGRVGSHRQTSTLNSKPYVAAKSMKMTRTWKAAGRYSESSVTCGVDRCGSAVKIQHEASVWRVVKEGPRNRMSAIPLMCNRTHEIKHTNWK